MLGYLRKLYVCFMCLDLKRKRRYAGDRRPVGQVTCLP